MSTFVLYGYFGIGNGDKDNCGFYDHVFFGVTDIFLFNVSILIGYKQYILSNNLYEFAVKGNLPSKWQLRRNKMILNSIWGLSISDIVIFVVLNIYWTFINRNMQTLRIFNFSNKMAQFALMVVNAILFVFAYLMITKTLNYTIVDSRQKNLHRNKRLMLMFTVTYFCLAASIFWSFIWL